MMRQAFHQHFVNMLHTSAVDRILDAMVEDGQIWTQPCPQVKISLHTPLEEFLGLAASTTHGEAFFTNPAHLTRLC